MKSIGAIFIGICLVILNEGVSSAQALGSDYHAAIGLRAGETAGITFKINTNQNSGLEFIAGILSNWFSLTGLYEKNSPAFKVEGMKWYYGGGGHIAFATKAYNQEERSYSGGEEYALGLDGIVGLEYKIPQIPFAISIDMKPLIEIYQSGYLNVGLDPGFGIKFTF